MSGTEPGRVFKFEVFIIRGNVCGAVNTSLGDTGRVCIKFAIIRYKRNIVGFANAVGTKPSNSGLRPS